MKTNPRQLEQQLAWRCLLIVAIPLILLLPTLAILNRPYHAEALAKAEPPLFTMAEEPAPRAIVAHLLPAIPETTIPTPQVEPCISTPTPHSLEPVTCNLPTIACLGDQSRRIEEETEASAAAATPHPAATSKIVPSTSYIVHSPLPPYPSSLRRRRITGSVGVRISVSPQGLPTAVDITQPSGHAEFDTTTRSWILRHWRFHPATSSGRPIASTVTTTIHFRLDYCSGSITCP